MFALRPRLKSDDPFDKLAALLLLFAVFLALVGSKLLVTALPLPVRPRLLLFEFESRKDLPCRARGIDGEWERSSSGKRARFVFV